MVEKAIGQNKVISKGSWDMAEIQAGYSTGEEYMEKGICKKRSLLMVVLSLLIRTGPPSSPHYHHCLS